LVAVGLAGGLTGSTADGVRAPAAGRLSVTTASYVCPHLWGTPATPTTVSVADVGKLLRPRPTDRADVSLTRMASKVKPTRLDVDGIQRVPSEESAGAGVVAAIGTGAANVVAMQSRLNPVGARRGALSVNCVAPATEWWLAGAEGGIGFEDELFLANPGGTVANLTVTAWSEEGPLDPPKLRSFALEAGQTSRLAVGDYFPDAQHVVMHIVATSGRVSAALLDSRIDGITAAGIDWIPPTLPPDRTLVVPGFIGGNGVRRLVVANPGEVDATVDLRVARYDGNFTPAEHPSIVVRAGHALSLDVSEAFANLAGAIVLNSDQPVVAAGLTKLITPGARMRPDIQWQPAVAALTDPAVLPDNLPPFERAVRLYLVAPDAAGSVRLTTSDGRSKVVQIEEGRTAVIDLEAEFGDAGFGPLVMTPVGAAPVYVSRSLYALGAHGPLVTAIQPVVLPRPVQLPPVVDDPRAATG
jgi:hypothetical protein